MVSLNASVLLVALASPGNVEILEFTSASCGPCRLMQPTIQRLIAEGAPIRQVDINRNQQLAAQHRVTGVPCFVLLENGRELDRITGATTYARLRQMLAHSSGGTGAVVDQPIASPNQLGPQSPIARTPLTSPEANDASATSRELLVQRILAATVRLKISDPQGHSYGSGTIIDTHGSEALVLTCAHIFRDSQGRGPITVDLFRPSGHVSKPGQLVSYDMERDVALVSVQPGAPVDPLRVAAAPYRLQVGQRVISAGCDRGGEPSQRETRVTSLNKYLGPANVEVAGQPVDGRSGGGLFTLDGTVVGVCFGAEPTDDEGLYAAASCAQTALDAAGLSSVYQTPQQQTPAATNPAAARLAGGNTGAQPVGDTSPLREVPANTAPEQRLLDVLADGENDAEIICVIRRRNRPGSESDVIVLDRASPAFVQQLARELRDQSTRQLVAPSGARDVNLAAERLSERRAPMLLSPDNPTTRGQSPLR